VDGCRADESQQELSIICSESEVSDRQAIVTASEERINSAAAAERDRAIDSQMKKFAKMLTLSIVYSSNIGGTATLTGTPTNLIIAEKANKSAFFLFAFIMFYTLSLSLSLSFQHTQ